jgi:hypothetical protein
MSTFLHICTVTTVLALIVAGCATTDSPDTGAAEAATETAAPEEPGERATPATTPPTGKVTMTINNAPLGDLVRAAGIISGGGIVLMNGLEYRTVENLTFRQTPVREAARQLAEGAGLLVEETPAYTFLYAEGYESLLSLDPGAQLDPGFTAPEASVAFGSYTSLYNVFAALSRTLPATIVADNAVADAHCGELALPDVPIATALRAILQSARVPADGYVLKSTEEYVFIASPGNGNRDDTLLNGEMLTPDQNVLLDAQVSVMLPEIDEVPEHMAMVTGAKTLVEMLPALSEQLGLPVHAAPELNDLPVNYTVINNVRRRTALNLLIWQWLHPGFGYELRADGSIYIRPS